MKDIRLFLEKIKRYFKDNPQIIAVYLFGSYAANRQRPGSDVDIAVLFEFNLTQQKRFNLCLQYYADLSDEYELDIVDMNSADYPLLYEIFNEGELVFERDREKRVAFQALKLSEYSDLKYFEDLMSKGLMRRARNLV
ncbi:DNA polymerase beta domain protein region [Caldithrix abyssi DSM 13497]|uniref:DNA polymerase beta domain protein region n=1 Tax=Caldithrix abyssi DSM 13497 TaxID=880073 RepID=H1XS73_CALAY|nr:nucleotidyltransferase domain-containing protein [Caldithrix abyssi]APF20175.1 Nucleotidyltransferase domain-containing protein [Caldithrix abyssi DSM 13497]EHO40237.1 DNA polymerase beta domain protein region [Caldithrix abyssi DSM 13497]